MLSLKTWTATHGTKTIIATAESVEVARQLVADRHGIELANVDLVPAVTHSRWSRAIEPDKDAIVAELERLEAVWRERLVEDASKGQVACQAFSSGIASGLSLALKVVEAGGALPPEVLSDDVNQVSE
jgi:hypothetical protein